VAITRAVKNLYVIETNKKHELLALLGLTGFKEEVSLQEERSSQEDTEAEGSEKPYGWLVGLLLLKISESGGKERLPYLT
jgi:hypothetical protein